MNPLVQTGKRISWVCATLYFGAALAWAADRYALDIPAFVMAGDPDVTFSVTPLSEGLEESSSQTIRFVDLPAGVTVEPAGPGARSAGSPARFIVEGRQQFRLGISPSVLERRVWVKVQNNSSSRIQGAGVVNVERPVQRFSIIPLGNSAPRAGVSFRFQIMAYDEAGAVVRSFQGPVSIGAARGVVNPSELGGDAFKNGAASIDVVFSEGDPLATNRLSVTSKESYGVPSPAQGAVDVIVLPKEGP